MSQSSQSDAQAVATLLASLPNPVKLVFFTQSIGCEMCLPARQVLDEIVALGRSLTIEELNLVLDKERAAAYGVDARPPSRSKRTVTRASAFWARRWATRRPRWSMRFGWPRTAIPNSAPKVGRSWRA